MRRRLQNDVAGNWKMLDNLGEKDCIELGDKWLLIGAEIPLDDLNALLTKPIKVRPRDVSQSGAIPPKQMGQEGMLSSPDI